jgi:hypothetical protein
MRRKFQIPKTKLQKTVEGTFDERKFLIVLFISAQAVIHKAL